MKKYIDEIKETIKECWDIDNMSAYYRDKLINSLNNLECEVEKLDLHSVSNNEAESEVAVVKCPECLNVCSQEELDMFGGLCEECSGAFDD